MKKIKTVFLKFSHPEPMTPQFSKQIDATAWRGGAYLSRYKHSYRPSSSLSLSPRSLPPYLPVIQGEGQRQGETQVHDNVHLSISLSLSLSLSVAPCLSLCLSLPVCFSHYHCLSPLRYSFLSLQSLQYFYSL